MLKFELVDNLKRSGPDKLDTMQQSCSHCMSRLQGLLASTCHLKQKQQRGRGHEHLQTGVADNVGVRFCILQRWEHVGPAHVTVQGPVTRPFSITIKTKVVSVLRL
jgi:hypothetical protein